MRKLPFLWLAVFLAGGCAAWGQNVVPLNNVPARVVGHVTNEGNTLSTENPDLIVGREFWSPYGVVEDTSVSPPILYVSDTNNSRVLAWKNATAFNNGQQADLVIGQKDFYSTYPQGPGQTYPGGLTYPGALAVDANGNLYVMDAGNNRIVRYPKPFTQQGSADFTPDLWIGQPNLNSSTANYTGLVAAQGLALSPGLGGMAFDSSGNLWVTDVANSRVLEFQASALSNGGGPLTAALEIGQLDFVSSTRLSNTATTSAITENELAIPTNLTFDSSGWLYISDFDNSGTITGINRVLVFKPPFSSGQSAYRLLGVYYPGSTPTVGQRAQTQFIEPNGMFFLPGNTGMGVVDSFLNRILIFPPAANWADVTTGSTVTPPTATSVIGQAALSISDVYPNQATVAGVLPGASSSSLYAPAQVYFSGTALLVADSGNNRVVELPYSGGNFGAASSVLGQDNMTSNAPNLIEGKEFRFTVPVSNTQSEAGAGVVIDASSGTPHLYVADTYNNRILGFNDARKVTAGVAADIVIGEPDFATSLCNYPTGDPNQPTQSSLCEPTGLAVDTNGNLYVADRGNGRVLRFPAPFAFQGQLEQADLVLGQTSFTTAGSPGPSPSTMSAPDGLAFSPACSPATTTCNINGLLVADSGYNRVLYIPTTNGTFNAGSDDGKAAIKVYGEPDFATVTAGNSDSQLSAPHSVASDADGRVYVADTNNSRVLIFSDPNNPQTPTAGAAATLPISSLNGPLGVWVNATTGELWVANTNAGQAIHYPQYDLLQFNLGSTTTIAAPDPIALTQDQYGNLVMADASNRVSLYFPGLQAINGASLISSLALAPGMFASICSPGTACANSLTEFGSITASSSSLPNPIPLPTTLGDVQVNFNGSPVPLYYVSPNQINFVVPMNAPTSNTADLEVMQASTGRLYASAQVPMNVASPGILLQQYTGAVRAAVVANADSSLNTPTNPAKRGTVITIYATGQGFVPGAPPDGSLPQGLVTTPTNPRIVMNGLFLDEIALQPGDPANGQFVQFSGLSPSYPGIWQINVQIPMAIPPGVQTILAIVQDGIASVDPNAGTYVTTFSVSQ
jgi:uncharacterized protein (TIGR03437 family)